MTMDARTIFATAQPMAIRPPSGGKPPGAREKAQEDKELQRANDFEFQCRSSPNLLGAAYSIPFRGAQHSSSPPAVNALDAVNACLFNGKVGRGYARGNCGVHVGGGSVFSGFCGNLC